MTDLETTGDIPGPHEILEIGLVLFDQGTLEILDTMDVKTKPKHVETAVPGVLDYNGYSEEGWQNAVSIEEAMRIYGEKCREATFCSYNVSFDWMFVNDAFYKAGLENPMSTRPNHDRLDVLTMAWSAGLKGQPSLSLKTACEFFGVPPEPEPHSALNGAMTAYELFKKIRNR